MLIRTLNMIPVILLRVLYIMTPLIKQSMSLAPHTGPIGTESDTGEMIQNLTRRAECLVKPKCQWVNLYEVGGKSALADSRIESYGT